MIPNPDKIKRIYELVKAIHDGKGKAGDAEEVNRLSDELNKEGFTDDAIDNWITAYSMTEEANRVLEKI